MIALSSTTVADKMSASPVLPIRLGLWLRRMVSQDFRVEVAWKSAPYLVLSWEALVKFRIGKPTISAENGRRLDIICRSFASDSMYTCQCWSVSYPNCLGFLGTSMKSMSMALRCPWSLEDSCPSWYGAEDWNQIDLAAWMSTQIQNTTFIKFCFVCHFIYLIFICIIRARFTYLLILSIENLESYFQWMLTMTRRDYSLISWVCFGNDLHNVLVPSYRWFGRSCSIVLRWRNHSDSPIHAVSIESTWLRLTIVRLRNSSMIVNFPSVKLEWRGCHPLTDQPPVGIGNPVSPSWPVLIGIIVEVGLVYYPRNSVWSHRFDQSAESITDTDNQATTGDKAINSCALFIKQDVDDKRLVIWNRHQLKPPAKRMLALPIFNHGFQLTLTTVECHEWHD